MPILPRNRQRAAAIHCISSTMRDRLFLPPLECLAKDREERHPIVSTFFDSSSRPPWSQAGKTPIRSWSNEEAHRNIGQSRSAVTGMKITRCDQPRRDQPGTRSEPLADNPPDRRNHCHSGYQTWNHRNEAVWTDSANRSEDHRPFDRGRQKWRSVQIARGIRILREPKVRGVYAFVEVLNRHPAWKTQPDHRADDNGADKPAGLVSRDCLCR